MHKIVCSYCLISGFQLEQFRKQKAAERAKKASQSSTTQPVVDNSQQSVTDSDGVVASMSNGPLNQSAETSSNETHTKSSFSGDVYNLSFSNIAPDDGSKERSKQDDGQESLGKVDFSNSLEVIGSLKDLTVNTRPEVVPYSNIDKQSSESFGLASTLRESDAVPNDTSPFSGTSMQMDGFIHGSGLISSRKGTWLSYEVDVVIYFVLHLLLFSSFKVNKLIYHYGFSC